MMDSSPPIVPVLDDELSLEAAYQRRILRYLVYIGGPLITGYGILTFSLKAPWYVAGLYLMSAAILGTGFAALMRPMDARRFFRIHRVVSLGYIATLLAVQSLSLALFNRVEYAALVLFYPSMVLLFIGRTDGLPSVIVCGVVYFSILFLSPYEVITPDGFFTMKVNLVLIYALVAACTYFIDTTRRRFQSALVHRQQEALRMKQAAEQASRAKSEFLGNMSHELRTPSTTSWGSPSCSWVRPGRGATRPRWSTSPTCSRADAISCSWSTMRSTSRGWKKAGWS